MVHLLAVLAAIASTMLLLHWLRRRAAVSGRGQGVRVLGTPSPILTWIRFHPTPWLQKSLTRVRDLTGSPAVLTGFEILVIGLWSLWIGRKFLDLDPTVWPAGREFGAHIYGFHLWEQVWRCGTCSLWNGMFNGGWPSLSDPFTGFLHPLSAIAGTLAGAVNGAKLTVLGSAFMAGMAQWWLARVIGLRRWSRIWGALAAVSGGHLLGRMEIGAVNLVLSTAATSLAFAGAVDLALTHSRKSAIRLAILLALSLVAGGGYMQVALAAWAPWVALLAWERGMGKHLRREFLLSVGLGLMIAGIFLIPFAHVGPNFAKFADAEFATSQPFDYIPLNLVIHDWDYYLAGDLGSTPFPYLHTLYIGWPALVLAGFGLAKSRQSDLRLLLSLAFGAVTMFWLAAGVPFRWASAWIPGLAAVRHPALIASLAIPAILAMAGYGLDRLLETRGPVAEAAIGLGENRAKVSIRLAFLVALPIVWALLSADRLAQNFLQTVDRSATYEATKVFKTPGLEWVSPPYGEHYWVEPALAAGLKLTNAALPPFWWAGRALPPPFLETFREAKPAEFVPVAYADMAPVYRNPGVHYAFADATEGVIPCVAQGYGGDLTIACDTDGGTLIVQENAAPGWMATVNGEPTRLAPGPWLALDLPPGPATVRLRFLPIDAGIGALITVAGILLGGWLWIREGRIGVGLAHSEPFPSPEARAQI